MASDQKILFQNSIFPISEAGLEVFKRDIGTGYHISKGIMLALGKSKQRLAKYQKEIIETTTICPTILDLFDIEIPNYMNQPL